MTSGSYVKFLSESFSLWLACLKKGTRSTNVEGPIEKLNLAIEAIMGNVQSKMVHDLGCTAPLWVNSDQ